MEWTHNTKFVSFPKDEKIKAFLFKRGLQNLTIFVNPSAWQSFTNPEEEEEEEMLQLKNVSPLSEDEKKIII